MRIPRTWIPILAAAALVVALPVAWYLISPLFISRSVDEALPVTGPEPPVAIQPASDLLSEATPKAPAPTPEPARTASEATPADEVADIAVLAGGEFYNVVHEGRGRALVYRLAGGARVLRFEDFQVLNGPDLHVYLVPIAPVQDTLGVEIPSAVDLGELKGNIGNQNYELPAGLDLAQFKSVVVWCQPFRVPFIAAPLSPP